jgi:single-strand DNA-binding protein
MNKVFLMGRLATEPELRYTTSGVAVCTFTLAVDRPKAKDGDQGTDWPTIVAWRQKAEFAANYLKKGRKILVTATVRTRTYEDKEGKRRKVTEFQAEEIEFCDSKPQNSAAASGYQEGDRDYYTDGFTPVEDDGDFPF